MIQLMSRGKKYLHIRLQSCSERSNKHWIRTMAAYLVFTSGRNNAIHTITIRHFPFCCNMSAEFVNKYHVVCLLTNKKGVASLKSAKSLSHCMDDESFLHFCFFSRTLDILSIFIPPNYPAYFSCTALLVVQQK